MNTPIEFSPRIEYIGPRDSDEDSEQRVYSLPEVSAAWIDELGMPTVLLPLIARHFSQEQEKSDYPSMTGMKLCFSYWHARTLYVAEARPDTRTGVFVRIVATGMMAWLDPGELTILHYPRATRHHPPALDRDGTESEYMRAYSPHTSTATACGAFWQQKSFTSRKTISYDDSRPEAASRNAHSRYRPATKMRGLEKLIFAISLKSQHYGAATHQPRHWLKAHLLQPSPSGYRLDPQMSELMSPDEMATYTALMDSIERMSSQVALDQYRVELFHRIAQIAALAQRMLPKMYTDEFFMKLWDRVLSQGVHPQLQPTLRARRPQLTEDFLFKYESALRLAPNEDSPLSDEAVTAFSRFVGLHL